MNDRTFARAFVKLIKGKDAPQQQKVCKALAQTLAHRGEISHGPRLMAHIEEAYAQEVGGRTLVVETARILSVQEKKRIESFTTTNDVIRYIVRSALIAGARITISDTRVIDYSFTGRLGHQSHYGA